MIANEIIDAIAADPRLKSALEEMAAHPLTSVGSPTVATTFTAALDRGRRQVRISIEMLAADAGPGVDAWNSYREG